MEGDVKAVAVTYEDGGVFVTVAVCYSPNATDAKTARFDGLFQPNSFVAEGTVEGVLGGFCTYFQIGRFIFTYDLVKR